MIYYIIYHIISVPINTTVLLKGVYYPVKYIYGLFQSFAEYNVIIDFDTR